MVVNRRMNSREFLQTSQAPKSLHGPFSSSKRLVRILSSIVQPGTHLLPLRIAEDLHRGAVGSQLVCFNHMRLAIALHQFPEEFQCTFLIPALRGIGIEHFTFVIHRPPKVMRLTIYLHKLLIQMPIRMSTKLFNPFLSDLSGKQRAETVPPETDSFMANVNTAFVQQIFHISKRKWITHIHHNRQADNFGRRLEVLEWVAFCHSVKLDRRPARLN